MVEENDRVGAEDFSIDANARHAHPEVLAVPSGVSAGISSR